MYIPLRCIIDLQSNPEYNLQKESVPNYQRLQVFESMHNYWYVLSYSPGVWITYRFSVLIMGSMASKVRQYSPKQSL